MRWFPYQTPGFLKWLFPALTWEINSTAKTIFLTFDDGPNPDATSYVLNILDRFDAKATFFMLGENVEKYPELVLEVVSRGHTIGNHSYSHFDGWRLSNGKFFKDIEDGQNCLDQLNIGHRKLFRPPYGRITWRQGHYLINQGYEVIMWQLLSGDFFKELNLTSARRALLSCGSGSIVVFHDSDKFLDRVKLLLPEFLEHFSVRGYSFEAITSK
ncbi:MAG: polysaccharide deacetylase family protein [Cyclobacteriaceae bacterium]